MCMYIFLYILYFFIRMDSTLPCVHLHFITHDVVLHQMKLHDGNICIFILYTIIHICLCIINIYIIHTYKYAYRSAEK